MIYTILMYIGIYLAIGLAMWLWDACIGFDPYESKEDYEPAITLVFLFWPITLPIILGNLIYISLKKIRDKRIDKKAYKTKLRIAAEKELEKYNEEVEEEVKRILDERKS
jgi:hypothetical protein